MEGYEGFIIIDEISVVEEQFVQIVEAKRSDRGEAIKQCLLAMKDMSGDNAVDGEEVDGFATTRDNLRMLR